MPSNALPPRPSPFYELPLELVKRIVELVKEQDEATKHLDVRREEPPFFDNFEIDTAIGVDGWTAGGYFPSEYGRGVEALSTTSSLLRRFCLPYLVETVTANQLVQPFFRFFVAGTTLSTFIRHVDLKGAEEHVLKGVASALPHLPKLDHITVTDEAYDFYVGQPLADSKVRRLILGASALSSKDDTAVHLRTALERFDLRELEVESPPEALTEPPSLAWLASAQLPSLESLTIPLCSNAPTDYFNCLSDLHLTRLTINILDSHPPPSRPFRFRLPHLQHLTIVDETCEIATSLVSTLADSPLLSLTISHPGRYDCTCEHVLPLTTPLPSTLSTLRILFASAVPPTDYLAYSAALSLKNIHFLFGTTPGVYELRVKAPAGKPLPEEKKRVFEETLRWAERHLEGLYRAEDVDGLQDLGDALVRVRQLKMLMEA